MVVPILNLGLERAFDLAEAMESRAFGSAAADAPPRRRLVAVGLILGVIAVVSFGLGYAVVAAPIGVAAIAVLRIALRKAAVRSRYRPLSWRPLDLVLILAAGIAGSLVVTALMTVPESLGYFPYPRLGWPSFTLIPGLACLLLASPAVTVFLRNPR